MDTWRVISAWVKEEMINREEKNLSLWKSNGGIIIDPDIEAFQEATKDVWKKLLTEPGQIEIYERIKAAR
jgi:TRAP-type C4-dicarboxylate transport system substrate-binding protein